jgi:thiosulfate/3-mercaptopyruvate sulfurtransferase
MTTSHPEPPQRTIPALVDGEWLNARLGREDPVVLDVRSPEAYAAGHVPGAVNEPFVVPNCAWIDVRDGLLLEVPDQDDLSTAIGRLGILSDTRVVVVSAPGPSLPAAYGLAEATRVALTLIQAGVPDVAVLDGGHEQWVRAGLPTTTEPTAPTPVVHRGRARSDVLVPRRYVEQYIGRVRLLDNRDPDVYFGHTTEEFADQAGHIPTARCLPTPWIWKDDSTYLPKDVLARMAAGVIAQPADQEVIVYCGVGGYASAWWFLLTQLLGHPRVRFYDGGAQEWSRVNTLVPHCWD